MGAMKMTIRAAFLPFLLILLIVLPVTAEDGPSFSYPAKQLLDNATAAQSEEAAHVVTVLSERTYDIDAQPCHHSHSPHF